MKGKMVTFLAASGPGTVTVDCNGTGFAVLMVSTETIETVIDGFVFENCRGDDNFSSTLNPPLPAGSGGAVVFAGAARGLLRNCIIRLNSARVAGGGVLVHTTDAAAGTGPTLTNTIFERNSAMLGAAVSVSAGTLTLNDCQFQVHHPHNLTKRMTNLSCFRFQFNMASLEGGGLYISGGNVLR